MKANVPLRFPNFSLVGALLSLVNLVNRKTRKSAT